MLVKYDGSFYFPVIVAYPETTFGGEFRDRGRLPRRLRPEDHRGEGLGRLAAGALRLQHDQLRPARPAPAPPSLDQLARHRRPGPRRRRPPHLRLPHLGPVRPVADAGESVIGVAAGAVQGYFGGLDRSRLPALHRDLVGMPVALPADHPRRASSSRVSGRCSAFLLLFSWMALVDVVRAEFLRGAQFRLRARRASARRLRLVDHVPPRPAQRDGGDAHLPAVHPQRLDHDADLARLPRLRPAAGSPSLGELLAQGKANLQAPWLGLTAFFVLALMLSLLIFIGEAVRDAFDPRKIA